MKTTLKENLKTYLDEKQIENLLVSLEKENKHAVLLNPSKMSDETFVSLFPNVNPHPIVKHAYLYDKNEYDLGKSIYHLLGCYYLQEPSAMVPAYLLNCNENDTVLDLCAAPGGKSIQSSFNMHNKGLIISNDLSKQRAFAIVENAERLGLGNLVVTNNDFSLIYEYYANTFTKIILDAPCSGSGMFRKSQEVKDDWTYEKVLKCAEIQKTLILCAYNMLKAGGTMCYSTCSFSYEEDEEIIQYLLNNTNAELVKIDDSPLFYVNEKKPYGIHLFPSLFPGEGHYICLIKKPGESSTKQLERKQFKFGDFLFEGADFNYKKLNVLRLGVKVGEVSKDIIKYDYHYAHYLSNFDNEVELDKELTSKYLNGDTLSLPCKKGFVLLKYQGVSLDTGKSDGARIKNRIPSRIRNLNKVTF